MKNYKFLFFDLDGTITDSIPGVRNSLIATLKKYNIVIPDEEFRTYVGPPLSTSLKKHFNDSQLLDKAIEEFREIYHESGIFESSVYEGIEHTLRTLKCRGYRLFVATSKKDSVAEIVLRHFKLFDLFERVFGANELLGLNEKEDVLKYALDETSCPKSQCLMIGDTKYDAYGASIVGIDCVFCSYGFGKRNEILTENVVAEVAMPIDLLNILLNPCKLSHNNI